MQELLHAMVSALVDDVGAIQIHEVTGYETNVLELKVAKADVGKIIGRQGKTADAIRTILGCAAAKDDKKYILHIIDKK